MSPVSVETVPFDGNDKYRCRDQAFFARAALGIRIRGLLARHSQPDPLCESATDCVAVHPQNVVIRPEKQANDLRSGFPFRCCVWLLGRGTSAHGDSAGRAVRRLWALCFSLRKLACIHRHRVTKFLRLEITGKQATGAKKGHTDDLGVCPARYRFWVTETGLTSDRGVYQHRCQQLA